MAPPSSPYSSVASELQVVPAGNTRIVALDGLRGIAVVAVVAYHAWPDSVPGGWLGVSLFFTLSGYLISGLVIDSMARNQFGFTTFYQRRFRRLVPAALTTYAAVLLAVALLASDSLREVAFDVLASVGHVENWRAMAAPGGYDAIFDNNLRPLAHIWSLSIEEQIYLVVPLSLAWLGARRALITGAVLVVAGSAYWWGNPDAYYATPVRLVEVLAGVALAVAWRRSGPVHLPRLATVAAAAIGTVAVFTLTESSEWISRGALPMAALVSTGLVAYAASTVNAGLGNPVLVWLGERSYAIYLIHWPLLVLWDVPVPVVIVATLVLAEVSYRAIEQPIRSGIVIRRPLSTLGGAGMVLGLVALTVAIMNAPTSDADIAAAVTEQLGANEAPASVPSTTVATTSTSAAAAAARTSDETTTTTATTTTTLPGPPPLPDSPTLLLVGDSTAMRFEVAVKAWINSIGGRFRKATGPGCSPVFADDFYQRWTIVGNQPPTSGCRPPIPSGTDVVLVIDHGSPVFDHLDNRDGVIKSIRDADLRIDIALSYAALIESARRVGAEVVFTTAEAPFSVEGVWDPDHTALQPDRPGLYNEIIIGLARDNDDVFVIDTGTIVDSNRDRYQSVDGLHLTPDVGAVNLVVDVLAPILNPTSSGGRS